MHHSNHYQIHSVLSWLKCSLCCSFSGFVVFCMISFFWPPHFLMFIFVLDARLQTVTGAFPSLFFSQLIEKCPLQWCRVVWEYVEICDLLEDVCEHVEFVSSVQMCLERVWVPGFQLMGWTYSSSYYNNWWYVEPTDLCTAFGWRGFGWSWLCWVAGWYASISQECTYCCCLQGPKSPIVTELKTPMKM